MAEADFAAKVSAAQTGDPAAFSQLVRDFHALVLQEAQRLLRDPHEAQDCTQEAFAEAFATLERLREPLAWPAWLRSIVRHRCLRRLRRRDLQLVPLSDEVAALVPDLAGASRERFLEQWAHAGRLIAALPPLERDVSVLFYLKQCSQQEIATFLELPLSTVNNRLHQARERLVHFGESHVTIDTTPLDPGSARSSRIGTIIKVNGPVIDVRFDGDVAPELFAPLAIAGPSGKPEERMLIARAREGGVVSCLATTEDRGLQVGAAVLNTGPLPGSLAPGSRLPAVPQGVVARALDALAPQRSGAPQLLETGIKAIDLLCPLPERGSIAQVGTAFVGRMVLLDELRARLKDATRLTCFCMVDETEPDPYRGLLHTEPVSDASPLQCYWVLCGGPAEPGCEALAAQDTLLYHSPLLAFQGLYPALDPERSWSRLLGEPLGSQPSTAEGARSEHAQLASRARAALLLAKRALTDVAGLELIACRAFRTAARQLEQHAARVLAQAPPELRRAHKLQLFLTQPFETARAITGWQGVSVSLADTLAGVRAILDGDADDLPASAFRYRGNLDDVRLHAADPRQY